MQGRERMHEVRITLIGMAGIGKSTWALRLENQGFRRFDCDHMIAERLSSEVAAGEDLIAALGSWMGLPWEPGYEERAARYQRLEKEVTSKVLKTLGPGRGEENVVVDTAGSVVYTGDEILEGLAEQSVIVHLACPSEVRRPLLQDYLKRPGPVLWRGMFQRRPEETLEEALVRCYERLLEDRERRYARWAHVSLEYRVHRRGDPDCKGLIERIRAWRAEDPDPGMNEPSGIS